MATANSNAFGVSIVGAGNKPGDAIPPLSELAGPDGAKWTFDGTRIFRDGVDTKQPFTKVTVLYINLKPEMWIKDSVGRYSYWDGAVWGWTGHGPDGGFF